MKESAIIDLECNKTVDKADSAVRGGRSRSSDIIDAGYEGK